MAGIASDSCKRRAQKPVSSRTTGKTTQQSTYSAPSCSAKNSPITPSPHDSDDPLSQHRPGLSAARPHTTALVQTDVHAVVHHRFLCSPAVREVPEAEHVHR